MKFSNIKSGKKVNADVKTMKHKMEPITTYEQLYTRYSSNRFRLKDQITIHPGLLEGSVTLPISKSIAHRVILAKALVAIGENSSLVKDSISQEFAKIEQLQLADDIIRTLNGAKELLATKANLNNGSPVDVEQTCPSQNVTCKIYCKDSGTTLRMIMPIACTLYPQVEFKVSRALAERPIEPLLKVLEIGGCHIDKKENIDDTFSYFSQGKFQGGNYHIPGNISSQYISGLLYALPLSSTGGQIHLTTELASKPYLDMSLVVLKDFGINIETYETDGLLVFQVPGQQKFKNIQVNIDQGDWSAGSFFAVANALGSQVAMTNLDKNSLQGDKAVYQFIDEIQTKTHPVIDLENYPDLFPILAVLASYTKKVTTFTGISRLELKESNRIKSTGAMIENLGGVFNFSKTEKTVDITGLGSLNGGTVDSAGDHRIAMAAAIAGTRANGPVTILNSSCCDKSYPDFFKDYTHLGGKIG